MYGYRIKDKFGLLWTTNPKSYPASTVSSYEKCEVIDFAELNGGCEFYRAALSAHPTLALTEPMPIEGSDKVGIVAKTGDRTLIITATPTTKVILRGVESKHLTD